MHGTTIANELKTFEVKETFAWNISFIFQNIIHYLKISIIVYLKVSEGILCLEKKIDKSRFNFIFM